MSTTFAPAPLPPAPPTGPPPVAPEPRPAPARRNGDPVWVRPALLGRDYEHWNFFFDSDSSYMEGNDWTIVNPDSFRTDGAVNAYGTLDLYLMGLMAKSEIDSFFVVNDPSSFDPPGTYIPASASLVNLGCRGRATWWHIPDIEAVNGPRVPDAASAAHSNGTRQRIRRDTFSSTKKSCSFFSAFIPNG